MPEQRAHVNRGVQAALIEHRLRRRIPGGRVDRQQTVRLRIVVDHQIGERLERRCLLGLVQVFAIRADNGADGFILVLDGVRPALLTGTSPADQHVSVTSRGSRR